MNLRDLRYLVTLADLKHFGRAAEACFVSQPTLSTQLKKFEDELGVTLIERHPRNVMLTPVGEAIVRLARNILREADEMKNIARGAKDPEAGTVRLGIFPTLGAYLPPHIIPSIVQRFPALTLNLIEDKSEIILKKLQDGELDCAILALPIHDDNLHISSLYEEDFVLAVHQSHPMARQKKAKLEDLAEEKLLLLDDGHCLREQALKVCHLAGASENMGFRATSLETLRHMVAANVGMTLLPALTTHPPAASPEAITLLPFSEPMPHRKLAMVWRKSSALGDFLHKIVPLVRAIPAHLLHAPVITAKGRKG